MPCSDVTERIEVVVGPDDRLVHYDFTKRTCGQGVGAKDLLHDVLGGRTVDDILGLDAEGFLALCPVDDELLEFLSLKHFFAVQSALDVLTGREPGGPGHACAAATISYDGGHTVVQGLIAVDLVTERIASCGNCRGCGSAKAKKQAAKVVFN